jgi:dTDP-4-dehydrorhamnose reductase
VEENIVKIAVNGASGQLGHDVVKACRNAGHKVSAFEKFKWDITMQQETQTILEQVKPDVLIHCAAYTKVDESEENSELAFAVNGYSMEHIAKVCHELNIKLIYISTDYVFDGNKSSGYTEEDQTNPLNRYGESKLVGERNVIQLCPNSLILRTSWLFGEHGNNFVQAILRKAKQGEILRVVDDQIGCPTFTKHLADKIISLVETNETGIRHVSGNGSCSWFQFAREILSISSQRVFIQSIATAELGLPAKRPSISVLLSTKTSSLPPWQTGLQEYLQLVGGCHD